MSRFINDSNVRHKSNASRSSLESTSDVCKVLLVEKKCSSTE